MIPGSVSRVVEGVPVASATSVTLRGGEVYRVTGTTQINTINPPLGTGQNQVVWLIPTDGAIILGTSGNILIGVTMAQNRVVQLVWLKSVAKWYIENGA
jgi:hypothetical protein